ncbi:4Fe-4S binding protein [bacterium]|nr:4Fe-4S binding protein [bacterium]
MVVLSLLFGSIALSAEGAHVVDAPKCVGCKLCVPVCPTKAITMIKGKAVIDPAKCVDCALCVPKCPTKAISKKK